jgi:hypothetical protein
MGFTKLDSGILRSSVMAEPPEIFKVWIAFLAACESDGVARVSPIFISTICHLPKKDVYKAIEVLSSPDEDSRSEEEEGRRIIKVTGGYRIVNYLKYREFTHSNSSGAVRQKRYRDKQRNALRSDVTDLSSASVFCPSASDPDQEDKRSGEKKPEHTPREIAEAIYKFYPAKDVNNKNRSTGKTRKLVDKIESILKKNQYPLGDAVKVYVLRCQVKREFLKNLGTFLNNLPDPEDIKEWNEEIAGMYAAAEGVDEGDVMA